MDRSGEKWNLEELEASVKSYLEIKNRLKKGERVIKKDYYKILSSKFGRSEKAFEYRMQNISYVLSIQGKNWINGLTPASNVGTNIGKQLEEILARLENRGVNGDVLFELRVSAELRKKTNQMPKGNNSPRQKSMGVINYERDPEVKAWVLKNATGICECCRKPAPFLKESGEKYLEIHHMIHLAEGGADTIDNVVALCPNCHREIHYGSEKLRSIELLLDQVDRLDKTKIKEMFLI